MFDECESFSRAQDAGKAPSAGQVAMERQEPTRPHDIRMLYEPTKMLQPEGFAHQIMGHLSRGGLSNMSG